MLGRTADMVSHVDDRLPTECAQVSTVRDKLPAYRHNVSIRHVTV